MAEFDSSLPQGTLLYHGTYRIDRVIGRGGFGITYLAVNTQLGTPVAIKEFFPKGMLNRDESTTETSIASKETGELTMKLKTKFVKEAQRIASLHHDSIVRVTGAFEENGTAYYVMDFIEGQDLQSLMKYNGPLSVKQAVWFVNQVGKALEYLHSLHINHLDVKPANILVDSNGGKVVLIDFGLSKQYDNGGQQTSTTPVGVSEGYAPIEQYKSGGVQTFSAQTDVYALGAALYYLLTGQRPPSSNDLVEEELRFTTIVPEYLQTVIRRAMSTRRADRYPTVGAFLAAIEQDREDTRVFSQPSDNEQTRMIDEPASENDDEADEEKPRKSTRFWWAWLIGAFIGFLMLFARLWYYGIGWSFLYRLASAFNTSDTAVMWVFTFIFFGLFIGGAIFYKKRSRKAFWAWLVCGLLVTGINTYVISSGSPIRYRDGIGVQRWPDNYIGFNNKDGDFITWADKYENLIFWRGDAVAQLNADLVILYYFDNGKGYQVHYEIVRNGHVDESWSSQELSKENAQAAYEEFLAQWEYDRTFNPNQIYVLNQDLP